MIRIWLALIFGFHSFITQLDQLLLGFSEAISELALPRLQLQDLPLLLFLLGHAQLLAATFLLRYYR